MTSPTEGQPATQTAHRPHLLYIAWGFPPCRAGGVYRALATANYFAAHGWRVTVLTADRETFLRYTGADTSLEREIHPEIEVRRIPFEWPLMETDLRKWSAFRAHLPTGWRKVRVKADNVSFPETTYGPWRRPLERGALQVHANDPVDLVIATANPHVAFAAAYRLHRAAGVPYVMDYRDAWLLNVFTGDQTQPDRSRAARWERTLVTNAHQVWFVNEPIADWHRRRYPEQATKVRVVENGYDEEFAPKPRQHTSPPGQPLVFGYIGTITAVVPIAEFLAGWKLARSTSPLLREAEVHIYGYIGYYSIGGVATRSLIEAQAAAGVRYLGPVEKAEVAATYETFDALALILGTGRYVTSGKAYEYIASGLPVAAVHEPGNAATEVFAGHPRHFGVADLSPEQIAHALVAAAESAVGASAQDLRAAGDFALARARTHQLAGPFRELTDAHHRLQRSSPE